VHRWTSMFPCSFWMQQVAASSSVKPL
jgi:hypothetical protein